MKSGILLFQPKPSKRLWDSGRRPSRFETGLDRRIPNAQIHRGTTPHVQTVHNILSDDFIRCFRVKSSVGLENAAENRFGLLVVELADIERR